MTENRRLNASWFLMKFRRSAWVSKFSTCLIILSMYSAIALPYNSSLIYGTCKVIMEIICWSMDILESFCKRSSSSLIFKQFCRHWASNWSFNSWRESISFPIRFFSSVRQSVTSFKESICSLICSSFSGEDRFFLISSESSNAPIFSRVVISSCFSFSTVSNFLASSFTIFS